MKPLITRTSAPRLFLPALFLVIAASLTAQSASQDLPPADLAEMEHCHLTLEILKRFYETNDDLAAVARSDAKLATKLNAAPVDISSTTTRLLSESSFAAAIARHRFTPHTFTVVQFTVLQTVIGLIAKQEGASAATLDAVHVAPGNIALFEQHGKEIDRMQAGHRR